MIYIKKTGNILFDLEITNWTSLIAGGQASGWDRNGSSNIQKWFFPSRKRKLKIKTTKQMNKKKRVNNSFEWAYGEFHVVGVGTDVESFRNSR